jgi:hypothetical protein
MSVTLLCYLCSGLADYTLPSGILICARCAYQNDICISCPDKCDKEKCEEEIEEKEEKEESDPYQFKFKWGDNS